MNTLAKEDMNVNGELYLGAYFVLVNSRRANTPFTTRPRVDADQRANINLLAQEYRIDDNLVLQIMYKVSRAGGVAEDHPRWEQPSLF